MKKINIKASFEVRIDQEIEVSDEQFELLNGLDYEDVGAFSNQDLYNEIEGIIDFNDILEIDTEFTNVCVEEIE